MEIKTGNYGYVKQANKAIVLSIIRSRDLVSRAEISKITGLNKTTVSTLVGELIKEDVVIEAGLVNSKMGRRPLMLRFNPDCGSTIGVDICVDYTYVILTNLNAEIIWERKVRNKPDQSQSEFFDQLFSLTDEAVLNAPPSTYGVIGIGVSTSGVVNTERGIVLKTTNSNPISWEDKPLADILRGRYQNLIVKVDNIANLGALGEKKFGIGQQYSNLIYLYVGTGIGAGIIINNQLYTGVEGVAGEIGHFIVDVNGLKCIFCGSHGCWSLYAGADVIKDRLEEMRRKGEFELPPGKSLPDMSFGEIKEMADDGNRAVIDTIAEVSRYLGIGIANIVKFYNPQAIIIGGMINELGDWMLKPVNEVVREKSLLKGSPYPYILFPGLGDKSSIIGAATLIIDEVLTFPEIGIKDSSGAELT